MVRISRPGQPTFQLTTHSNLFREIPKKWNAWKGTAVLYPLSLLDAYVWFHFIELEDGPGDTRTLEQFKVNARVSISPCCTAQFGDTSTIFVQQINVTEIARTTNFTPIKRENNPFAEHS